MPSADRFSSALSPTEGKPPVNESTVDPTTAEKVRQLLEEAQLLESAFTPAPSAGVASAAPTVPVPPPGYTLKTVHHTTADGSSRVEYEIVPLAPLTAPSAPAGTGPAPSGRRSLPDWLDDNRRRIKATAYLTAGGTLAAGAAIYGPAIGAGISAAAAGLAAAALTVLKVVGVLVVAVVVLRLLCPKKKSSSGTFEFTGNGTWRK
jgi:hypothetical protein